MLSDDYCASKSHQQALTTAMAAQFSHSIDAMLTPASTGPAPDAATTGDPCMNAPWSYTGLPTVSFPIGLSSDGWPLAIQLAGPHHHDWRLLNAAEACERLIRPIALSVSTTNEMRGAGVEFKPRIDANTRELPQ